MSSCFHLRLRHQSRACGARFIAFRFCMREGVSLRPLRIYEQSTFFSPEHSRFGCCLAKHFETVWGDEQSTKTYKGIRKTNPGPVFNTPVVTTDIGDLPYTMDGDTKVFHLIAEVVKQQDQPRSRPSMSGASTAALRGRRFR